jgi:hypothetical protein
MTSRPWGEWGQGFCDDSLRDDNGIGDAKNVCDCVMSLTWASTGEDKREMGSCPLCRPNSMFFDFFERK